jgi:putative phosphoesterase
MRIAILSDSHDNVWMLDRAMPHLADSDAILHCGDLCSPFVTKRLIEGVKGKPVYIVWGNNDGDRLLHLQVSAVAENIHFLGEFGDLTLDGLKIAVTHYPRIARPLAESGKFDLVCCGHDHKANEEHIGRTILLNPGELHGLFGRSTIALFLTTTKKVAAIDLGPRT